MHSEQGNAKANTLGNIGALKFITMYHAYTLHIWPHLQSLCEKKIFNRLRIARHNVVVHELTNLLKSSIHTRHLTFANANTKSYTPHNNTIPLWILRCTCITPKCACLAKLRPNILCIERSGV